MKIRTVLFCAGLLILGSFNKGFAMANTNDKIRENFEIKLSLYDGHTLPNLIPTLSGRISSNQEMLGYVKYIFFEGFNKTDKAAFLTLDIFSPNNPQLWIHNYKISIPPGTTTALRVHALIYLDTVLMVTKDEDAQLDYKIKSVSWK